MSTPTAVLTIAGTDSAGGAGVHADLRAFAAFGVHGATAVAALTAQSTRGIDGLLLVPTEFVVAQVESVVDDLRIRAVKTGFLACAETVGAVGELAAAGRLPRLVVDPVLVRATGDRLFDTGVEHAYIEHLLPHATVATPNRAEAGLLVGRELRTVADMADAALEIAALGAGVVVVKGGDADDEGDRAVDVVATVDGVVDRLDMPMVSTGNDHGAGCSFGAAIAAGLARGDDVFDAIRAAKRFVHAGIVAAEDWHLGAGHGPIDAFASVDGFRWHPEEGSTPWHAS